MNIANNYQSNNTNFKSKISLVDTNKFWDKMSNTPRFKKSIEFPWTPKEIVKGPLVWTEEIKTCSAGGIVVKNKDGSRDVVMFHLNPDATECQDIPLIKKILQSKIGKSRPLQALLVGSKDTDGEFRYSGEYFDKVFNMIKEFKIPTTKLKGSPMGGYGVNVLYDAPKDTWTILNTVRDDISPRNPERKGFTGFKEVLLSSLDWLTYDC